MRFVVGAALCCEEVDAGNRSLSAIPASSQHKAAPTGLGAGQAEPKPAVISLDLFDLARLLNRSSRCDKVARSNTARRPSIRSFFVSSHGRQTDALETAGGGKHPHYPRGGRRVRQPGDAVLDRQGFRRDAAPGAQGLLPGQAAIPGDARRHPVEIPGDVQFPRQDGRGNGPGTDHPRQP